jgi:hypothetical protein
MTNQKPATLSRRKLLAGLAVGGVAAGAIASPTLNLSWVQNGRKVASGWWDRMFFSLARGGFNEWSGAVGTLFTLSGDAGSAALELVAVKPFDNKGRRPASLGRDRAFAAIFEAKDGLAPAGDATYAFKHAEHGSLDIFMTARAAAGAAARLEAVFN